jgi:hypothetical protein
MGTKIEKLDRTMQFGALWRPMGRCSSTVVMLQNPKSLSRKLHLDLS